MDSKEATPFESSVFMTSTMLPFVHSYTWKRPMKERKKEGGEERY